jgi:hypothetical protein
LVCFLLFSCSLQHTKVIDFFLHIALQL